MEPAYLAAVEAVLLIAIAIFFLLLGRRLSGGGAEEVPALRAALADLTQRLAVAEHKATQTDGAEAAARDATKGRDEAREAQVRAETELAARAGTLAEREAALADAKALVADLRARTETLVAEKSERERLHAHEAALVAERTLALGRATEALQVAQTEAEMQRGELSRLRVDLAALGEKLLHEQQEAEGKLAVLHAARTTMTEQFKALADEIMQRHGETFSKKNQEQLDGTLAPLRQKILEFQQSLQTAHLDGEKERAALAQQIRSLSETSARMSSETQNLTQALRGKSQTQGAWGEMILQSILEKSGLREGQEYEAQTNYTNDEGERLRPDVVVRLPNEQRIVIDAKVSLTAFTASVGAETEEERMGLLRGHAASMRQHVRTLAGKEYHRVSDDALDYVVMFVPIEGALAAALTVDPELTGYAVENSVYIATPTTLMIALRTVANVWHVERRNRNAEEIASRAGKIYDKVVGFVESMESLGKALGQTHRHYDRAMNQLARGNGNVLRQLEQLKLLGAKSSKSLAGQLLDDNEPETAPMIEENFEEAAE
jgi:DNA recombination protein RmuC